MKYSIITFGCRVNQADSLAFEADLLARGAEAVAPDAADVVVVNTCSVTATADQSARQTIRRIARDNPAARIVVTGCYATRRPDEVRGLPNVDHVVGNDGKATLVPLLRLGGSRATDERGGLTTAERFGDGEGSCGAPLVPGVAGRTAFTLRVQTGCAQPCAYCIIPSTRGRPSSVPVDAVLAQIDRVVAAGFKEIALTGVHLGSYGRDLVPPSTLAELLDALSRRRDVLFRISSLEPMDCTSEIVDLVASSSSFAPHFHLPLQHASDRILVGMRRPYSMAHFAALVDGIRARIPDAAIGSDVIVGFPGESDADFEELASYLERSPLTHIHVFPYSDRPGTVASTLGPKVHGSVVRDRARQIREIGRRLTVAYRASQVGAVHRALTIDDGSLAVTGNYLKVRIPAGHARNEWVTVEITGSGDPMIGEVRNAAPSGAERERSELLAG